MACAAMLLALAGCGVRDGPARYDLSGEVTFDGKPVPVGSIVFAPDSAQGNSGPGATADIQNGRYRTMPRRGTIGGPHTATIIGFDGEAFQTTEGGRTVHHPMGKPLFAPVTIKVDLPKKSGVHDFAVPKN